ncbi:hypothetical protein [Xanthomarina spongicola]|uniref:Uncharacterized protein n=1 Tax=Xanthomarina spongicola TaxID=570520 RepID=A0A316DTY1_9FLAO|nr:hypothetical protein [Xanthomarina spongicola]PWK20033.1 hypothetical protein LX78_01384 [Xanthomarina spongicola]
MIKYFFVQSVLTLVIFFLWITIGDFSDGEVGMTPLNVLIAVALQFVIGSILFILLNKRIKINYYVALLLYLILYEVVFSVFTGSLAIPYLFDEGFSGAIYRGYFFSSIIAGVFTTFIIYLFYNMNKNITKA